MKKAAIITVLSSAVFLLAACTGTRQIPEEPHQINGTFSYTNSIVTDYYVEHAVALVDMYGFVQRDPEWEIPIDSQTLGFLDMDLETMRGTFELHLPELPTGEFVDVDNDAEEDTGVQVYAVAYWPNLTGGLYSEGDDRSRGWPNYLASVKTDTENKDEVIAGSLVVWSPDGEQQFPTDFGGDGLLFTADDPVGPIPDGFSIVNLDAAPFGIKQEAVASLTLYEPQDVAIKDYSSNPYTVAFDKMFEIVRREYAFSDIEGKSPDWDALYAELQPRVQEAEDNQDANEFYLAIRDFSAAFSDGHVGIDAGGLGNADFEQATAGGYGLSIMELNDGRALVMFVLADGPAALAGIELGAEVTAFNGQPISEAIGDTPLLFVTMSSDFAIRYQQARYMLRAQVGDEAEFTFTNPNGSVQTVTLTAIEESDSFSRLSIYYNAPTTFLPVNFRVLDEGIGYVSIDSSYDDLGLIIKLFERALQTFEAYEVPGIIIDMRYNSGGANLGLAGFLTDQEIPMGQLEYFSDATGQFEPEGVRERVLPNQNQYRFETMLLLVGQACFSACELEAYGFAQVPGMIVMGQTPSSGVEAEVARGQFILPEDIFLQVPTGRFTLPDGSIFLEGVGVQPTISVPIDETTVFSEDDVVLQAAIDYILGQ
jgi:C-terminal processing protease CtpA/Prc